MAGCGIQLLFLINCAHCPLQRDKLHLKLIIPNLRWALCDIYIYIVIRKLQKVRIALSLPSRTKSDQARADQVRPGPWVFGASQSVKICCQCCNLFIYFSSFFVVFFFFVFAKLLLLLPGWAQKCTSNTKRNPLDVRATCAHCLFHTLIGPQALLCALRWPPLWLPVPYSQLRLQLALHPQLGLGLVAARQPASNWLVLSCRTFSS